MGIKSWRVKLWVESPEIRATLEYCLSLWNTSAALLCRHVLAMRRGDFGPEGQAIWEHLKKTPHNFHVLYPISNGSGIEKTTRYYPDARAFVNKYGYGALGPVRSASGCLWKQLTKAVRERTHSYDKTCEKWSEEHSKWLEERAKWEAEHPEYMAIRPLIDTFHAKHGVTRGRRNRWALWLQFLMETPELVRWRNKTAKVVPLTDSELKRIRSKRRGAARREQALFYEKNPELAELNRIHGIYERRFARSAAKRKNPDGFRHRPTFTLPSEAKYPDWPRFQAGEGWRDLDLDRRTICLKLPTDGGSARWVQVHFVPDPRLQRLARLKQPVKEGATRYDYSLDMPSGHTVLAQPQEVRLIRRGSSYFATIRLSLHSAPSAIPVPQTAASSPAGMLRKIRTDAPELKLITCAVDLGVRHLGAATIAREGEIIGRRILHNRFLAPGADGGVINIPSLPQIAQVRRQIRCAQRRSGRISPKVAGCRHLWTHYRHLCEDRYKKAVAAIFGFARAHGAHIVLFEDLKMLNPDSANERGVNRALQNWNRGRIVEFAKNTAEDAGLCVVTVPAYWTSRICARCNAFGVRFNQGQRRKPGDDGHVSRVACELDFLGHWFLCASCGRSVHADLNASENLHRVFLGTFPTVQTIQRQPRIYEINGQRVALDEIQQRAVEILASRRAGDTPF